jgi:Protein O-mannosyl-transferase TMEM260-like
MVSSIRRLRPTDRVGDLGALGRSVLPPLVVGLAVIVVVWPGLMPGVGYWDTGEFQTVAPILGTAHPTGYPTYVILGFLVNLLLTPLGEPAFRMNVFALLSVAVAAGAATWLAIRLSGSIPIGLAVGLGLATTPETFAIATHAEPHALHLAFVAVIFAVLVGWEQARRREAARADRWLVAAAVLFGLSAGNHSLTLLLAVPIGLYVLAVQPGILRRPRLVATCAAGLVGALVLVYLELPLRAGVFRAPLVYAHPETWDGFWYIALAEQFRGSLNDPLGDLPRKASELSAFATAQFGPLAPAVIVGFLATIVRHPRYAVLSGSAMVITVLFNASYTNADITRYYLGPVLWAWTWLGVLLGVVVEQLKGAPAIEAATVGPPDAEAGAAAPRPAVGRLDLVGLVSVVLAIALLAPTIADFVPRAMAAGRRDDTAARRWVDSALSQVEPDAVVVSWWSTSTVLWYATLVDGQRTDVTIVDDRTRLDLDYGEATDVIATFLPSRPVYVIRANNHDLGLVLALYNLEPLAAPATNVYRVVSARAAGS